MTNYKINYYVHRYGIYYVVIMFFGLLIRSEIKPNSFIFWGFSINLALGLYFMYVKGIALGIVNTYEMLSAEEEKNDNKNN